MPTYTEGTKMNRRQDKIKRIVAIILSLVMVLSFSITINADEVFIPNDTKYEETKWAQDIMNVQKVWNKGYFGSYATNPTEAPVVAIIDSGIAGTGTNPKNPKHSDLNYANILTGKNFVEDENTHSVNSTYTDDIYGHGTRIAGIIAACINNNKGIAGDMPNVKIRPYRCVASTTGCQYMDLADCIYKAVDDDVDVINISICGVGTGPTMSDAINQANKKGIIVCAAVGNDGDSTSNYPATYNGVVGVGAIGKNQQKWSGSNYNSTVDVVAPGENIVSLSNTSAEAYGSGSGTSFACPHVAALAAMCKSIDPSINHDKFMELLKSTSRDAGDSSYDTSYGYGIVDYGAVLDAMLPADNSIWKATISGISAEAKYTGEEITFDNLKLTMPGDKELIEGKDYTVTYKNNKNDGIGMLVISGEGEYTGKMNKYFTIVKKQTGGGGSSGGGTSSGGDNSSSSNTDNNENQKIEIPEEEIQPDPIVEPEPVVLTVPTIKKLAAGRKSFTIKWKKVADVDGYRLQYSTTKTFKKGTRKTLTINKNKTYYKVKKLKFKKKIYVRMCSYKTVLGKKHYSDWCKIRAIKFK